MKIGIFALLSEKTLDPVSVARRCEELGFESIWAPEHAIIPVHTKVPYPALDGKIPDVYTRFPDPFVLLGMMPSVTRTLKLGAGMPGAGTPSAGAGQGSRDLGLLFGRPVSLRHRGRMAGGRIRNHRRQLSRRWPITSEYIRAMKELWTKFEASFEGRYLKFPAVIAEC